jgi:DNA repair exonuclease SbcCD ATPase subunit
MLADIDIELLGLHTGDQEEYSAEQQANEDRLRALQEEYRATLSVLQDERSQILEEARAREANLQAQLEIRTRELALAAERSEAALDIARNEMDQLIKEQALTSTVEAQLGAYFINLDTQLRENRLDNAAATVRSMQTFINTPAFQALRSIQTRKELYTNAIHSFETMIEEARKNQAALNSGGRIPDRDSERAQHDLQEKVAQLELDLEEKNKTIEAFSEQGTGTARRLTELERSITDLRAVNSGLEAATRERNSRIAALETDLSRQTQTAENSRQSAAVLQQTVNTLQQSVASLQQSATSLQSENARLNQTVNTRDSTIRQLEQQNTVQEENISNLNTQLVQIRQALQALSQ